MFDIDHLAEFSKESVLDGATLVLTHDYEQMLTKFVTFSNHLKASAVYIQIYSSWICHEKLWEQAKESYYRDFLTGDRYDLPSLAPNDVKPRLEYYEHRRFSYEQEFLGYLEEAVPGFSKNTWIARHRVLLGEARLWCVVNKTAEIPESVFARLCENVVLNGLSHARMLVDRMLDFEEQEDGTIKPTPKPGAPLRALGVDKDDPEAGEKLAKKVWDLAIEGHNEISKTNSPRAVVSRFNSQIFGEPKVTSYAGEDSRIWLYIEPQELDEDDDWIATEPFRMYFSLFNEKGEEVLARDWPDGVAEYVSKRLRLIF